MLDIRNLFAITENQPILKGLNLTIEPGQVHAIMGPNGAGKSTLAKVLAGHPSYEVTGGNVTFLESDLLALDPEDRSRAGLFMSFQYPPEVGGVTLLHFLHAAHSAHVKARGAPAPSLSQFREILGQHLEVMEMAPGFLDRSLNEGFSGGEKKRNEILQMSVLQPRLAVLDETDSGLDIDALKVVAQGVNRLRSSQNSTLLITHYQRLLDYVRPDRVHVMIDGKIVESAGPELALKLENEGYERLVHAPQASRS